MKIIALIVTLIICSGIAGTGFGMTIAHVQHSMHHVNPSLFLAIKPAPTLLSNASQETTNALTQRDIDEIKSRLTSAEADSVVKHDQIASLAALETSHFNTLQGRLDIYDNKFNLIVSIGGGFFTISTAIIAFVTFLEQARNRRRRQSRELGQKDED